MDIKFSCQKCHQKMSIDSGGTGQTVECPNCKEICRVPDILPIAEKNDDSINRETKDCPFCGEKVLFVAKKCKHCGETIDVVLRTAEEASRASNQKQNVYVNQNVRVPEFNQPQEKTSSCAIWSMWLGIFTVLTCIGSMADQSGAFGVFMIPALICGYVAEKDIKKSNGKIKGAKMARAGIIMGWSPIAIAILAGISRGMR